ncbi:RusA family crossover junction endodeoxyribonuclease [Amycolatopsis sp. NPDC051128]|uniref:RusA family crossover junction endodeoxyribonuclease n=1 Tax=Amycolatopsis sp. NPDC051128 TaxID=3155412 RepID=UPI00343E9D48
MAELTRFIPGSPAPQGSKRARPIYRGKGDTREFTGKVAQTESSKAVKPWRSDIRDALTDPHGQPIARFDGPVAVELAFVVKRPVGTPKTRATPAAIKKPDLDKLVRAVFDAITSAGVWTDDSAAIDVHATKRIAELGEPTGCRITIRDTTPIRPADVGPLTLEIPA